MSSRASEPNHWTLTTVTRQSGRTPRTAAFGRRSSSLVSGRLRGGSRRLGRELPWGRASPCWCAEQPRPPTNWFPSGDWQEDRPSSVTLTLVSRWLPPRSADHVWPVSSAVQCSATPPHAGCLSLGGHRNRALAGENPAYAATPDSPAERSCAAASPRRSPPARSAPPPETATCARPLQATPPSQ